MPAEEFESLKITFVGAHHAQWNAFVKNIGEAELTDAFGKVIEDIKIFAMPLLRSLALGEKLTRQWKAKIGWVHSRGGDNRQM
jgi:hypothetical protein